MKTLTNLEYNSVGGIDATYNTYPYTLTYAEKLAAGRGDYGEIAGKSLETLAKETAQLEANERIWRDSELAFADIELNKVQDGRGTGLVSDWRDYRNLLRDWPEDENFPDQAFRPVINNND